MPSDDSPVLRVERQSDGVAVVVLDRPERRNALSVELLRALDGAFTTLAADDRVTAAVLTGAGTVFCAGFDLTEMSQPALLGEIAAASSRYHRTVYAFPKPLVCAVNGAARAGGFDLTVLADVRLAAPAASFAHPEIFFGAAPLFTPLRWIVGEGRARELCLSGHVVDASEAERIGLVNHVVDADRLVDEAVALAARMGRAPAPTVALTKGYMAHAGGRDFEASFRAEHDVPFGAALSGTAPTDEHQQFAGGVADRLAEVRSA